jgi:hypothetical protein
MLVPLLALDSDQSRKNLNSTRPRTNSHDGWEGGADLLRDFWRLAADGKPESVAEIRGC